VTSQLIYDNLDEGVEKEMIATSEVLNYVNKRDFDVLILLGAGDLDNKATEIAQLLQKK
jgi:UDP-N-acetylmuramate--alanine ligase